jgi:hypothetical protein
VTVGVFAFAAIVAEVVAGGEPGFYGDFKHQDDFPSLPLLWGWGVSSIVALSCRSTSCGIPLRGILPLVGTKD